MKKLLAIAAVMAVALSASAQGTVDFRNRIPGTLSAPVFDVGGATMSTPNIVAELYWSTSATGTFAAATSAAGGAATPASINSSGAAAGFWVANGDRLVGVATGANVFLQVRAWDSTAGSFSAAVATSGASAKKWGQSGIFSVPAGDPGGSGTPPSTPNPAVMTGLTSFNLQTTVPEPSTIALGLLGAGALLIRRRK